MQINLRGGFVLTIVRSHDLQHAVITLEDGTEEIDQLTLDYKKFLEGVSDDNLVLTPTDGNGDFSGIDDSRNQP